MPVYFHLPSMTERPPAWREPKVSDGRLIGPENGVWDEPLAAACGFLPIIESDPPPVTDAQIAEASVQLVDGVPHRVWTVRDRTAEEMPTPPQLDPVQRLAALLAVSPSPTVAELAAVVGTTVDALTAEVEAWAAAGEVAP